MLVTRVQLQDNFQDVYPQGKVLFWRRIWEPGHFGGIPHLLSQHHRGVRQAISLPYLLSVPIWITDTAHKFLLFLFEALLVLPAFSPSSGSNFQKFTVCSVNEYIWHELSMNVMECPIALAMCWGSWTRSSHPSYSLPLWFCRCVISYPSSLSVPKSQLS